MSEEQQENFEQTNGENFETFEEQQQEATEGQEATEEGAGDAANEEDEDDRKLFVGNLSWETTQKDLKDYFSKYGEVTNCTLKTDLDTRRSRGFGFVVFSTSALLDKVLEEKEHKLHGRSIDPKRANPRKEVCKKIFCGKVDPSVPESDIKEYFSKFGEIDKVELPFDKTKDQRRAFCFVEFKTEESVKKVLEETAHKLNNVDVDVKKATPTNQSKRGGRGGVGWGSWSGGPGGRGGRGGRGGYNQSNWNQGYPGGNQGFYNQGGYGGYGNYGGGYGGYDQNYYQGYGNYGNGWGGYDQYQGYGGYDYSGWGYDQGQQQQSSYGKQPKGRGGGGYHPYSR